MLTVIVYFPSLKYF